MAQQLKIAIAGCVLNQFAAFPPGEGCLAEAGQSCESSAGHAVAVAKGTDLIGCQNTKVSADDVMLYDLGVFARERDSATLARVNGDVGGEFHRVGPYAVDERVSNAFRL
ncbi:hypothetical protein [Candidatus Palauibacter sp.]|uniref:hypothetical protein n=1 Tax=Candidatus Palauibacter sp. TaxID=3101350 RepID=UPI003B02300D